ncbi:MAG: EamA family transporter, partial [Bacilli bacterium]
MKFVTSTKKGSDIMYKGIIFAILSSVAYGVMPIFAKIAYANGSNPTSAIMFRFYFAVILLLCYFLITRQSVRV